MKAITGGIMPQIRRYAQRQGITVAQALLDREIAGLALFTEVCERVAGNEEKCSVIRSAIDEGLLPALAGDHPETTPGTSAIPAVTG